LFTKYPSFVNEMARPKKYKGDTEVVSFRIPKGMKVEIQKAFNDLMNRNQAVINNKSNGSVELIRPTRQDGEDWATFQVRLTAWKKENNIK